MGIPEEVEEGDSSFPRFSPRHVAFDLNNLQVPRLPHEVNIGRLSVRAE